MTAIVFCGPTLDAETVKRILPSAVLVGPAAVGDLYRASNRGPNSLVLIDGYFDHRLSVWHKEVLWALSRGQRVYGASSMGALRAAELAPLGMIGVGEVFELYRSGALEDDDEVAVVHEEAEAGYRRRSEAMVNIRATLAAARAAGALTIASEQTLVTYGKQLFYSERSYAALMKAAPSLGIPDFETQSLRDYLGSHGPTDVKRADAIALLERVRDDASNPVTEVSGRFRFAWTNAWHVFTRKMAAPTAQAPVDVPSVPEVEVALAAEEQHWSERLRALPAELADRIWRDSLERALTLVLADDDPDVDQAAMQAESELFRRARSLMSPEQAQAWMQENELSVETFSSLIRDEVLVGRHLPMARRLAILQVANALRSSSEYGFVTTLEPGKTGGLE